MIPTATVKQFQFGNQTVTLETGEIARQADGAVLVNMGDTVVLVTVVVSKKPSPERDFLPLIRGQGFLTFNSRHVKILLPPDPAYRVSEPFP